MEVIYQMSEEDYNQDIREMPCPACIEAAAEENERNNNCYGANRKSWIAHRHKLLEKSSIP
jgi:hypothetical protein